MESGLIPCGTRSKPTHPAAGVHERIIGMWYSSFSGTEIADMEDIAPITVYCLWTRAKKKGLLPNKRRPKNGF